MHKIRLIVNADDLGRGAAMDRGLFCAFRDGIVTSASLLANGPSFADAAREARAQGLPVGVHLNLAEGPSLSGEIRGLTTANGEFPGKAETRRRLASGAVSAQNLRAEISAQIGRLVDAGLQPDHFDTHQHAFLFPNVAQAILEVVGRFGINAARLPLPQEPAAADPAGLLGNELALYRSLAPNIARTLQTSGLVTPDGLWGMASLNRLDESALAAILNSLPPGTWELMVHPGGCNPADPFATRERETEVAALTSPGIRELVGQRQIQLIHFGELACAS
ncbi:MAG TPA: ChbG/HpnK family deacetylase [Desulfuromonadales bacterium]|nr:ChbG/HpnK family deacetylase [Desulfuromonadales bacterium]